MAEVNRTISLGLQMEAAFAREDKSASDDELRVESGRMTAPEYLVYSNGPAAFVGNLAQYPLNIDGEDEDSVDRQLK